MLFSKPFDLLADHYFFVPQVELSSGDFLWLSAPKPIVSPGTPFPAGFTDLQEWIRNENLAPDWLRVGTDIVGGSPAPTFNATFSLSGSIVPEPGSMIMLSLGSVGVFGIALVRRRRAMAGVIASGRLKRCRFCPLCKQTRHQHQSRFCVLTSVLLPAFQPRSEAWGPAIFGGDQA